MGDIENLADLLPTYYGRLFPFNDYYRWLSYGNTNTFYHREFSFTLKDDVYIRYQSFRTIKDLELEMKRLLPFKIDIGAVFNVPAKDHRRVSKYVPIERELVFDIDMTDYDEIRSCCTGTDICSKCWKFMALASKILDSALRSDFGFKHILWVFSGRRGIHCWVCDYSARSLDAKARGAVAEYLQILEGGDSNKKRVNLPGDKIHHSIKRALEYIESVFVPFCVEEQNILGTAEAIDKFLYVISDEEGRSEMKAIFDQCTNGKDRWNAFVEFARNKSQGDKRWYKYQHVVEEAMLQYAYPRLDINVSKGMNHLLKSPFCVHPKTGKICIPFSVSAVDKFQPDNVPTINTLIEEINEFDQKQKVDQEMYDVASKRIKDYKKTTINKSLRIFQEFLWGLESERKGQKIIESDMKMEF